MTAKLLFLHAALCRVALTSNFAHKLRRKKNKKQFLSIETSLLFCCFLTFANFMRFLRVNFSAASAASYTNPLRPQVRHLFCQHLFCEQWWLALFLLLCLFFPFCLLCPFGTDVLSPFGIWKTSFLFLFYFSFMYNLIHNQVVEKTYN